MSSTALSDQEILKAAEEYNVGDLNLGNKPKLRRREIINAPQLKNNIFPNDIVNREHFNKNFVFTWAPLGDNQHDRAFVTDCRDDGWEPVREGEWVLNREAWAWLDMPERFKMRWSVTRLCVNGYDEFLMYKDQEAWEREMARRDEFNERRIKATHEDSINTAMSHGVTVEGKIAGQDYVVPAPKRRSYST